MSPPTDRSLDLNYNKTKRLKEEDQNRCAGNDVEMTSSDRPGTSRSFENQSTSSNNQQQQQQQSLFSVLKYWMSKRVDPIGSANEAIENSSATTMTRASESANDEKTTASRHQNKRKSTDQKMSESAATTAAADANFDAALDNSFLEAKIKNMKKKKKVSKR